NLHDIEVMANEPTVINLVNLIISTALRERASDIHLVPFENSLQLRYRVDGLLQEKPPPPKQLHAALVSRIKIMADMNIAERFMPQDGHIQIHHRGMRVDIRVGTMPTIYGESLVMRLLEKNTKLLTPQELGLDPERAIRAALTGHQVFSTLHTNDSAGAVTRLIDMGIEAFLISSSLEGVLAQRLVRRICPQCRVQSEVAPLLEAKVEALAEGKLEG